MSSRRILVAGLGNVFFGDDGFGCAVARVLGGRPLPAGVTVGDFGIRAFDLEHALRGGYDGAILIDATRRGQPPGTLYWIDPRAEPVAGRGAVIDPHGMDLDRLLDLAAALGGQLPRLRVLGCEPACAGEDEMTMELSAEVARSVPVAVAMVEELVGEWLAEACHA